MLSSTQSWIFRGYVDSEKKGPKAKPRPVIVRFASYRKRMEFMYKKSKLEVHPNFNGVYLTEDLTFLRAKMLKYVKKVGKNKFVLTCIVMQEASDALSKTPDSDTVLT